MTNDAASPVAPRRHRRVWTVRLLGIAALCLLSSWSLNLCMPTSPLALGFPDPPNPNSHLAHHDELSQLYQNLEAIADEESTAMHRFLWRTTLLLHALLEDRRWSDVAPAIDELPFTVHEPSGCGSLVHSPTSRWQHHYFEMPTVTILSAGKLAHTPMLTISTHPDEEHIRTVRSAGVILSCEIGCTYNELLEKELYGLGSMGHAFFTSSRAKAAAKDYPDIVSVTFSYERIVNAYIYRFSSTGTQG